MPSANLSFKSEHTAFAGVEVDIEPLTFQAPKPSGYNLFADKTIFAGAEKEFNLLNFLDPRPTAAPISAEAVLGSQVKGSLPSVSVSGSGQPIPDQKVLDLDAAIGTFFGCCLSG